MRSAIAFAWSCRASVGIEYHFLRRFIPAGLAACCTLRAMTSCKTVHINVLEKAFYLHQADNGLNFPALILLNTFFFFLVLQQLDNSSESLYHVPIWRSRLTILPCLSVCWSAVHCLYYLSTHGGVSILAPLSPLENIQLQLHRKMLLWWECERGFSSCRCAVQNIPFLIASEHPSWVWGGVQSRACWEAHYPAALHLSDAIKQQGKRMEELVNLSHPACSKDYWCCVIHQSMT